MHRPAQPDRYEIKEVDPRDLRKPTFRTFESQFYRSNGLGLQAHKNGAARIGRAPTGNTLITISEFRQVKKLNGTLDSNALRSGLNRYAAQCWQVLETINERHPRSLMQVEYSNGPAFPTDTSLVPLPKNLVQEAGV